MITVLRHHWPLFALAAVIAALWQTPVMVPLKILIVFLHELSHLIAVLLTGGSPETLSLSPQQGGAVLSRGGNRFLTLSAGYLGSLAFGLAFLWAAVSSRADRAVTALLGATLLAVAALYVRDGFALAFCLGTGAALLAAARFLPHGPNDLILRLIGLTSIGYVPFDIFSDTLARPGAQSDAGMLAAEFGGPVIVWGGLWLVISLFAIAFALYRTLSLRPTSPQRTVD